VSQKSSPPKTFCNIFTQTKYIFTKFCQFDASIYPHILTSFGWFILIFNKMALIFLQVLTGFTVLGFEFQQVGLPWLHRYWWVAPIYPTSSHWIKRFGGKCWSLNTCCNRRQKQFPSLNCTLVNLVCFTAKSHWQRCEFKDYRKRLQVCVLANGGHFEHLTWKFKYNRY